MSVYRSLLPLSECWGISLTSILGAFFKPDISFDLAINNETNHNVSIIVKNKGYATATNVKFTMEFPHNIKNESIFSTEKYDKTNTSTILNMDFPRLAQGEGYLVRIDAWIDPMSKIITADKYQVKK